MQISSGVDHVMGTALTLSPTDQAQPSSLLASRDSRMAWALQSRGEPAMHPSPGLSRLGGLIHPERLLWNPSELRRLTSTVAAELTIPLLEIVRFVPEQRWWARLALTGGVELWLVSWTPGQGTRPHDHSGACGAFAVLLGELTEDYRYPGGPSRSALRRTGAAVGFGSSRAHQVRNLTMRNAASVHAYSPPLLPMREYDSLADGPAETRLRLPVDRSSR